MQACPTHINIPEFIRKIATENVKGSARTIFEANVFGMSCSRVCPVEVLCVGDCVYNAMNVPPIQIGKLQRYATDRAYAKGWEYFEAGADTGKSVGLVGGGPASLAAAHELRREGHAVTIYEKRDVLGGLNTFGVAPYKLRADTALEEVEWVLQIGGITVETGVEIGKDITWDALESRHDALLCGFGLGPDKWLEVPGEQLGGIYGAVEFIEKMKLGTVSVADVKHAVVLGGGNTAVDAVRELLGLGCELVTMVYRGVEGKMSGYAHEWEFARIDAARGVWKTQPTGFTGEGDVTGVTCVSLDDSKNPIAGSDFVVAADLVLLAIGQSKLGETVAELTGVTIDWGKIKVDDDGFTGRPGLYAAGDCANGGKEVVNAVAEGKRAAQAMHRAMMGDD